MYVSITLDNNFRAKENENTLKAVLFSLYLQYL